MGVDDALNSIGALGRWQVITYVLICVSFCIPATWQLFAIVFIGVINPHHCKPPTNRTLEEWVPPGAGLAGRAACLQYANPGVDNTTTACTTGWTYDPLDFDPTKGTMTVEWDLVCERDGWVELSQTIFNVGVCIGALIFTPFADRFGRKKLFFVSQFLMDAFGVALAFSPNYYLFCTFQFLTGAFSQGLLMTGFVIACELFPTRLRTVTAQSAYFFSAVGMLTLTAFAYFIREWRWFQFAISIPPFLCMFFWWWCPESLRWLDAQGRTEEMHKILERGAKVNNKTLPEGVLEGGQSGALKEGDIKPTILGMLKSPRPRRYMIIMLCLVLANNLMYFGISLMTAAMEGDRYLNFFINSILEVPGTFVAIILSNKYGRRYPLFFFHMWAGVMMGVSAVFAVVEVSGISQGLMVAILALTAKFGVSGAWSIELIYAQEIYPTMLRSTGLGITAGFGFIGAILAPYTVFLFRRFMWLPGVIFGVLSVGAAFLALFNPETLGRRLPITVEEIAAWSLTRTKAEIKAEAEAEAEAEAKHAESQDQKPASIQNIPTISETKPSNGHVNPAFSHSVADVTRVN